MPFVARRCLLMTQGKGGGVGHLCDVREGDAGETVGCCRATGGVEARRTRPLDHKARLFAFRAFDNLKCRIGWCGGMQKSMVRMNPPANRQENAGVLGGKCDPTSELLGGARCHDEDHKAERPPRVCRMTGETQGVPLVMDTFGNLNRPTFSRDESKLCTINTGLIQASASAPGRDPRVPGSRRGARNHSAFKRSARNAVVLAEDPEAPGATVN